MCFRARQCSPALRPPLLARGTLRGGGGGDRAFAVPNPDDAFMGVGYVGVTVTALNGHK